MWDEKVNHMIIIGIYVDNCLIIGKEKIIDHLIDELKRHEFNLKVEKNVNEYLSFSIDLVHCMLLTCIETGDELNSVIPLRVTYNHQLVRNLFVNCLSLLIIFIPDS
jgi:hypothetical protein